MTTTDKLPAFISSNTALYEAAITKARAALKTGNLRKARDGFYDAHNTAYRVRLALEEGSVSHAKWDDNYNTAESMWKHAAGLCQYMDTYNGRKK